MGDFFAEASIGASDNNSLKINVSIMAFEMLYMGATDFSLQIRYIVFLESRSARERLF